MWSWAAKRTAASSSAASSIFGSRIVRTATRWLAIPMRTSRGNFWLANRSLIASPERGRVVDLAVAHGARGERRDAEALDGRRPVDAELGGGDAAGLDVEPDDLLRAPERLRQRILLLQGIHLK